MVHRALADLVVLAHLVFVVFVVAGGLLAFRWRWAPVVQLPAALWGALVELGGWLCPLTPLENRLRVAGGGAGYSRSFVEHYVVPVVYPGDLTREVQVLLGLCVVASNLVVYALLWRARRRGGASGAHPSRAGPRRPR